MTELRILFSFSVIFALFVMFPSFVCILKINKQINKAEQLSEAFGDCR